MKYTRLIPILLLASLAIPRAVSAQEVGWSYRVQTGGWIGITVDFTLRPIGEQEETLVVITEVVEGSPAAEAGIRVGDTITHLDGRLASERVFSALPETLQPGDLVRIQVIREGRSREFLVEAGKKPSSYVVIGPDAERMILELETLSGNIIKNLDSVRLNMAGLHLDSTSGDMRLQFLRIPPGTDEERTFGYQFRLSQPFADSLVFEPGNFIMAPEFAVPFQAWVVESGATASIKEELDHLRHQVTAVRREELARHRALAAAIQGPIEEVLRTDSQIREIRAREADLLVEQKELSARLRQVSEEEMQRQWVEVQSRSEAALMEARRVRENAAERERDLYESERIRYRSPVLMGQTIMMGAQLAPLNPQLAEYFPVDEGVFVIEVMEGTLAFDAGLQGGDIIITIAGEEVTSLSDLRFGLGTLEGPLRIRVIRKGDPVEIVIRR